MSFKKHFVIVIGILVSLLAAYEISLYFNLGRDPNYLKMNSCIDNGGCWDNVDKICREAEPPSQKHCDRFKLKK